MGWTFEQNRPIYTQLVEQLQMRIICGRYMPGDKLKSVREMAAEAAVNPNTMQKAFAELERTGLIYTQRTAGRFVTEDDELIRQYRRRIALEKIEEFMKAMKEMGYSRQEVIALMERDREEAGAAGDEAASNETAGNGAAGIGPDETAGEVRNETAPQQEEAQKGEMNL